LPTQLVAAFRATLEEVRAADVVIHVRDVSDPETEAQRSDVHEVMGALGFSAGELALEESGRVIEAWNKIDRLSEFDRAALGNTAERLGCAVPISAATGEGVDALLTLVEARLTADSRELELALGAEDAAAAAWLFERGCVLDSGVLEDGRRRLRVRLSPLDAGRFAKRFGALEPRMALAAE
ncbi:MAG: GTPase HflX, partial [Pseudomonadota bacterium]